MNCLICRLNKTKKFMVFEGKYWQVDTPVSINLNGLFFIKTKRHVETLEDLNKKECLELGNLISKFAKKSKKISKAARIITMCLGFKEPHIHFWLIPITHKNKHYINKISQAVKNLADSYRDRLDG